MKAAIVLLVVGMLASGSINTISKKLGYETCSTSPISGSYSSSAKCPAPTWAPNGHQFRKPWTQTLVMFTGEAMCMLLFLFNRYRAASRSKDRLGSHVLLNNQASAAHSLSSPAYNFLSPTMSRTIKNGDNSNDHTNSDEMYNNVKWSSALCCLVPACFDLGGTTVSGIGLLFTSASVFQMLRGSIIFFTAIFSVLFLNRKLQTFHWTGMGLTVVGVTMIGVSSILAGPSHHAPYPVSSSPSPSPPPYTPTSDSSFSAGEEMLPHTHVNSPTNLVWIGNLLVIVSQLMSATQMVIEEKFLKSKKLPPEFVVGVEGSFGILLMVCIVLPIVGTLPGTDGK